KGDHVVLFLESYKPTRFLIGKLLGKFGVESSLLSILDRKAWQSAIQPGKTKLVVFESPTNPMTRIANIDGIAQAAKAAGALTLLDNTFAGFHQHGNYPIDLFVHSLTKFACGHGDAMGGVVIGDKALLSKMREDTMQLGAVL